MASGERAAIPLDIFGQLPRLSKLYTQICFCFPVKESSSREDNVTHVQQGYKRLAASIPWVAECIEFDHSDGLYKLVPPPDSGADIQKETSSRVVVKDLSDSLPSFHDMRTAGFPFSLLGEQDLASKSTLPASTSNGSDGSHDEKACSNQTEAAVFEVQVNFVNGGCLLVFSAQHNCMDVAAMGEAIRLFAKACSGLAFNERDLEFADLSSWAESLPISIAHKDGSTARSVPTASTLTPSSQAGPITDDKSTEMRPPPAAWSYVLFSPAAHAKLKAQVTHELPQDAKSTFISTDDVLCAFLWRHITCARINRLASSTIVETRFERLVNTRMYLNLSAAYPGNFVHKVTTTLPTTQVAEQPLGHLACKLRASLSDSDRITSEVQESAEGLQRIVQSRTEPAQPERPKPSDLDVKMSSWAKEKCYEFDFGGDLGKVEAVRRPAFEAWEGLAFLMPKREDGEIAAAVCLREEDRERLKKDADFVRWGRWVG